jgi:hypothetical protein
MIRQYFENRKQLLDEAKEQLYYVYERYSREISYMRQYDPPHSYRFPNDNVVEFWRPSDPSDKRLMARVYNRKNNIDLKIVLT